MGWGNDPHEGFVEHRRDSGEWTEGTRRSHEWGEPVAQRGAYSCGWRGATIYDVPLSPGLDTPEWAAHEAEAERLEELIYAEWRAEHYGPILGYEPGQLLILGRSDGGQRHFLAGRPVHAGTVLELLLCEGRWQAVRHEWSWDPEQPATATMTLGGPRGAERLGDLPSVTFELPDTAVLRWPERSAP